MKIAKLEFIPVNVPYSHPEVSSQVFRHGVTSVLVKATTDDGLVGWGESCTGADSASIVAALNAMAPYVNGRSPWDSEAIRMALWHRGLWSFRKPTGSFAYAGIDMALWDLRGKAVGEPLYNLLGGRVRDEVDYYYYLARGTPDDLAAQCRHGVARGYSVYYLKVGIDLREELAMVAAVRGAIGTERKIRLDANAAWTVAEALRVLPLFDAWNIDYIEQPVMPDPQASMAEVRARSRVPVCANEGLWTAEDAYRHIAGRSADVYCFSPYWVGSLTAFLHLGWMAAQEGARVCKHTHGELGIAAAAAQHLLLTLPAIVTGNQQTAQIMRDDVLRDALPIAQSPVWGLPAGAGLGVEVDEEKVEKYADEYRKRGQFLPYDPAGGHVDPWDPVSPVRSR